MLLCVVEKIYSLIVADKDVASCDVELEQREDYVFVENGISSRFYQVKATLSKGKWNEYEGALKKLIEHRDVSDNKTAPCYFVVARPISDWNVANNPYRSKINIYKYSGSEVKVTEVKQYICKEVEKILAYEDIEYQNIEAIYGSLCVFIDEKIAEMHMQGVKRRKYRISLKEFLDIIHGSVEKAKEDTEYIIKEMAYEHMIDAIQQSLVDICQQNCRTNYEDCVSECAAKKAYKDILSLADMRKYCKVINPTVLDEWEKELSYVEYFTKEKLKKYILAVFYKSKDAKLVENRNNSVGFRSGMNPLPEGILIPTLLDLSETFETIEESAQSKLQKLKENTEVLGELLGNSIVVEANDYYNGGSISQTQITSAWEEHKENAIGNIPWDIGFVTIQDLLKYFNDNGGNHE